MPHELSLVKDLCASITAENSGISMAVDAFLNRSVSVCFDMCQSCKPTTKCLSKRRVNALNKACCCCCCWRNQVTENCSLCRIVFSSPPLSQWGIPPHTPPQKHTHTHTKHKALEENRRQVKKRGRTEMAGLCCSRFVPPVTKRLSQASGLFCGERLSCRLLQLHSSTSTAQPL